MTDKKIKLLIADDHRVLRDGLVLMLKDVPHIELAATAENGEEVLEIMESTAVDVLLMDIQMPVLDGFETAKIVAERFPKTKILTLSMHSERVYIERMHSAGIAGYLLKSAGKEEIIKAIKRVHGGEQYFSSEVTAALLSPSGNKQAAITSSELTRREREILGLIASGMTNPEIADKLCLSTDTIKTHRKNMMRKLDVNNTAGLVTYALEHSGKQGE
ncbi:MAG: response regulator [Cryomorphaceae bacterium]|nr:response regulator transcription factor [Flavobacteriales bacterium]